MFQKFYFYESILKKSMCIKVFGRECFEVKAVEKKQKSVLSPFRHKYIFQTT